MPTPEEKDLQRIANPNPNPPRDLGDEGKGDDTPDLGELDTDTESGDIDEGNARAATAQQGATHPDDPHAGKGQEPLQPNLEREDERE